MEEGHDIEARGQEEERKGQRGVCIAECTRQDSPSIKECKAVEVHERVQQSFPGLDSSAPQS